MRLWRLLVFVAAVSACATDSTPTPTTPPTTGTLDINIVTTGVDIDADGFLLTVDSESPRAIPASGSLSISTAPGTHALAMSGLAFNCDVITAPAFADVILGKTTRVDVRASCTPYLRNAIIYVTSEFGVGQVMLMRPDGSRRERVTNDQSAYAGPSISPDGQSIAVASAPPGEAYDGIYLFDRFGNGRRKLVGRSSSDQAVAWSRDGTQLAFRSVVPSRVGEIGRIFIVNRDGTGLRQLTPDPTDPNSTPFDEGPSWSPDGKRLVFTRNGDLWLINADGTGLISTGVRGEYPAWSADGSQIAYARGAGAPDGIFAMDMSFTQRRVTGSAQDDRHPRWSPDGLQIVFSRLEPSGFFQIYKIGANGTGIAELSNVPQHHIWPSWSPNF